MNRRLPWRRSPGGGFVAYPEGERRADRMAEITRANDGGPDWHWRVLYDIAARWGAADTRQQAADAATEAWAGTMAEAARLEADAAAELELEIACAVAAVDGDARRLGDIAAAPYSRLIRANRHLRRHLEAALRDGHDTGPVEAVLRAVSDELASRRRRGASPG